MSDIVIRATNSSELERQLLKDIPSWESRFVYKPTQKTAVFKRQVVTFDPDTSVVGKTHHQQMNWTIKQFGGLHKMFVKVGIVGTAAPSGADDPLFGAKFASVTRLLSNGQVIGSLTDKSIVSDIVNSNHERNVSLRNVTKPTPALQNGGDITYFHIPLDFWFADKSLRQLLDTHEHRELKLQMTINSFEELFKDGETYRFTLQSAELHCQYFVMDEDVRENVAAMNYGPGKVMKILTSDNEQETQQRLTYASGDIKFSNIEIRNKSLVHSLTVTARNVTQGKMLNVNGMKLTSNGQVLFDEDTRESVLFESDKEMTVYDSAECRTMFFSSSKDTSWASGEVNFSALTPLLTVEVDKGVTVATDVITLDVCVHYRNYVVLDANTGIISKGISV